MGELHEITNEINELTLKIQQENPELYKYLIENPATIPSYTGNDPDVNAFSDYLKSLKLLLMHHIETRRTNSE